MIRNNGGVLFNSDSDDPFEQQVMEMLINSSYTMRTDLLSTAFHKRKDINLECDYPETPNIKVEDYQRMYDRSPIAQRVVNIYPDECWQLFPNVRESDDAEKKTAFDKALEELGKSLTDEEFLDEDGWYEAQEEYGNPLWSFLHEADRLAGIGHYGLLLFGLDDGLDLDQPVKGFEDNEEMEGEQTFLTNQDHKLLYISSFAEASVQTIAFENNKYSPRYRRPKFYSIDLGQVNETDYVTQGREARTVKVHWSRILHIADMGGRSRIIAEPRQRPVWNNLLDLLKVYGGDAESFWKNAGMRIFLETHPQLGGDVDLDENSLQAALWNMENGQQKWAALTGMSAKTIAPQVVDPKTHVDVQIDAICIKIPVPKRKFLGSERGELSSGQDDGDWNDNVRRRRVQYLVPRVVVPFVNRLIRYGVLPKPSRFTVDWQDPENMKPLEQAQLVGTRVEAMAKYIAGQVDTLMDPMDFLTREMEIEEEDAKQILERAMKRAEEQAEEQARQQAEALKQQQEMMGGAPQQMPPGQNPPQPPGQPKPRQIGETGPNSSPGQPQAKPGQQGPPGRQNRPPKPAKQEPAANEGDFSVAQWVRNDAHSLASTQINVPKSQYIRRLHDKLDPDDVIELEDQPHITVLYGLHDDVSAEQVAGLVKQRGPIMYQFGELSIFRNENFDVLKLSVESQDLHDLNAHLSILPHTNSYPDYCPHLTIAYMKPGTADKYIGRCGLEKQEGLAKEVIYSSPSRKQTGIVTNVFCPTGPGGGVNPHCKKMKSGDVMVRATKDKDGWKLPDGTLAPEHVQKAKIRPDLTEVHINEDPEGSLVAIGKDAKGRWQYNYSESHSAKQAAAKFGRTKELREKRQEILNEVKNDAKDPAQREQAECLQLVMQTGMRPGSEKNTKADFDSFGATTLQGKHVTIKDGKAELEFVAGKSKGKSVKFTVDDPDTVKMLERRKNSAGADGQLFGTSAPELSKYSQTKDGGGFKTKDHRTALATETAIAEINKIGANKQFKTKKEHQEAVKAVATKVSGTIGNTPAVALKSYIDPSVFSTWGPPDVKKS